jgi:hypothetical protein
VRSKKPLRSPGPSRSQVRWRERGSSQVESVGQRGEGEPDLGRLALAPLVTVDPDLGRIGEVRQDLDEPRGELEVMDVGGRRRLGAAP